MSRYFSGPDGVPHSFPDDVTPDEVRAAIGARTASPSGFGGFPSGVNPMNPTQSFMAWLKSSALKALPTAGGMAGGIGGMALGGPLGGIAGAGVGGAWGKGMQESASGERVQAKDLALSGLEQGAYEAGGQGLAKVVGAAATPLMRRALGVGKALPGEMDVAKTALAEGVGVSPSGVAKADRLRGESAQALGEMLDQAQASGQMLNTRAVTQNVRGLLRSNVIPSDEKADITKRLLDFLSDKTARIDPVTLKEIKQFWQNRARAAYNAAPGVMREALPPQARFAEQLALGAQHQLETIPGVGAQEARTKGLIELQGAVERAYTRPPRAFEIHKPGSYPAPFLNSPRAVSNYARFLDSPAFRETLRQSPRLAAALFMHQLSQPDNTAAGQ